MLILAMGVIQDTGRCCITLVTTILTEAEYTYALMINHSKTLF